LAGAWLDEGEYADGQSYRAGNVKAAVGVRLPTGAALRGSLRYGNSKGRAFPDDSGGEKFAVIRETEERDVGEFNLHVATSKKKNRWIDYEVAFDYFYRRENREGPGVAPGIRDAFGFPAESARDRLDHYRGSLRNTFSPSEKISATIGGDVYWEESSSDAVVAVGGNTLISTSFDLDRMVGGPFSEIQWRPVSDLSLTGSLRADFPDSSAAEVTPRVSARYRVPFIDVILAGSWGEGFKLPAMYSLTHPLIGDSDLKSERSWGWDFSASRSFWKDRLEGRLTYFEGEVKDLIDFDSALRQLVNRDKVTSKGVEFELSTKIFDFLELEGHLTYTKTDIVDSPVNLLNRPRWRGGWTLTWKPAEAVLVRVVSLAVGKVKDSSIPTGARTLDSWLRVDLSATWRYREHLSFYLKIDNLLDANYEETLGFRAPGIRPRAGVMWRL
jgi:vitamin B12 transporter